MMDETLTPLILASAAFVGSHFLLSAVKIRAALIRLLGKWGFLALYSVIALVTFVWMNVVFSTAPLIDVWPGADWTWWVALALMLFASILLVCGLLTPNPTAVMGERAMRREDAPIGIFRITRHPVMWAITLWAASHMMTTGDAAALIYFGALGALALFGMMHMDARRDGEGEADWVRFRARTSFMPFGAILKGRARVTLGQIGWVRIGLGVAFYLLLLYAHERVIGVVVAPWV